MIFKNFKLPIFILFFIYCRTYYIQEGHEAYIITNFTFGSNYYGRYCEEEEIFQTIITHKSNLWVWLGNAVYLNKPRFDYFVNTPELMEWDDIKLLYQKVKNNKYYKKLEVNVPIIGTWGEEEYGLANSNKENNFKEAFKQYYLDFLNADSLDQRRNRINMGLYSTYSFGSGYKTVRFILLDLKYDKTPKPDMLGEDQWIWLENIFKNSKETYTFICTSSQILPNNIFSFNEWFSESRKKLFDLIGKYKRNGVVFISGGLGFSQILKTFCPLPNIGYNLYECTSSGLGRSKKFSSFFNNLYQNDYLLEGKNFFGINFGQVKINWGENDNIKNSYIELEIFDQNDNMVSDARINYGELIYQNTENYYKEEKNMEYIKYMNIKDGISCEREIYHGVRTFFMYLRYYLTHLKELHICLFTIILIIIHANFFFKKIWYFIIYIFLLMILYFIVKFILYWFDVMNYNSFLEKIKS